jgi:hypothetical protein
LASPKQILDETFLVTRSRLIDIAATLDRLDRAGSAESLDDPRQERIEEALEILLGKSDEADRTKKMQQLFSRPYDAKWRREFGI